MSLAPRLSLLAPSAFRDPRPAAADALGRLVTHEALAGAPPDVELAP